MYISDRTGAAVVASGASAQSRAGSLRAGVWFEEVTASSLLRYDWRDGDLVERDGTRATAEPGRSNVGCIPVAAALFRRYSA